MVSKISDKGNKNERNVTTQQHCHVSKSGNQNDTSLATEREEKTLSLFVKQERAETVKEVRAFLQDL